MAFFFLPPPIQNRGGGKGSSGGRPGGEGTPAVPPMAAAGKWLKMERRPRGIDPPCSPCARVVRGGGSA
jgi:hypothetical protein